MFLVSVIAAVGLSAVLERINPIPLLDPFSVTALGAVLAAVGAALIWDLSVVSYLLVGLGIAVALLAGRGLSSMLRMGSRSHRTTRGLVSLDGVVLAAAIYYPLLLLVL